MTRVTGVHRPRPLGQRGPPAEREICGIVRLVASEHINNMTNIGLGIGSDGFCDLAQQAGHRASAASRP